MNSAALPAPSGAGPHGRYSITRVKVVPRLLAAVLLTLQAFAAGVMAGPAQAAPRGDGSHLICGGHDPGPVGRAMTAELMALAGLDHGPRHGGGHEHDHGDCPLCALVKAVTLPSAVGLSQLGYALLAGPAVTRGPTATHPARGPPVGLRAPPLYV